MCSLSFREQGLYVRIRILHLSRVIHYLALCLRNLVVVISGLMCMENQTQLLATSKCFMMSNMDCATCHNTHANERGNYSLYAQHCQGCHSTANHNFCKMADWSNISLLKNNCTKCHMPEQTHRNVIMSKCFNKQREYFYCNGESSDCNISGRIKKDNS